MSLDAKMKHLQMIQDVIKRMAETSTAMKRYALVTFAATAGLARALKAPDLLLLTAILVAVFCILDAQYLRQEKWFRDMYKVVRKKDEVDIDFDLTPPDEVQKRISICKGFESWSIWLMYGPLFIIDILLWLSFTGTTTKGGG